MAQVLPAERDLRRVIGDGDGVPDGEVEGLSEQDLLELHRWLVLLRTYDERSVVYHRQGRIGTYAIYWNHEAMQAGSVYALEREDWIFPSYRESAIGLLRGMPASTILSWWRGHPAGWWNPARLERRLDLRPDRDARAARGRARLGQEAARRAHLRDRVLRRRRHLRGRLPRGRQLRRGHARAARPLLQQQPVGDLDAASPRRRPPRRSRTRRSATASPACGSTAATCSRSTRRRARRSTRARAGEGPTLIEARHLPRRAACDGGRPERVHRPRSASRRRSSASASAATRPTCAGSGSSRTRPQRRCGSRPWS